MIATYRYDTMLRKELTTPVYTPPAIHNIANRQNRIQV